MVKPTLKCPDQDAGAHVSTSILPDQEQVAPMMSKVYDYHGGHIPCASVQPSGLGQPFVRLEDTGNLEVLQAVFHLPNREVDLARTQAHHKSKSLDEPNLTIMPASYCSGINKFNFAFRSLAALSVAFFANGGIMRSGAVIAMSIIYVPLCHAVTCPICQDTISGCTGPEACPRELLLLRRRVSLRGAG